MKPKIKLLIDLAMTILLLCQMAYMLIGEAAHEWMGTGMFLLFLAHHALNYRWHKNLVKGKYTPLRVLQTVINVLIFLSMIGLMISGIIMSRTVFVFLPISGGMSFARLLHMIAAYWGFILMSVHLGLHWNMIMGRMRKACGIKAPSPARTWILRILALLICCFGIFAFVKNNISDYLFLRTQFVFFDMSQPLWQFFAEYLGMLGLWVCLGYCVGRLTQKVSPHKKKPISPKDSFMWKKDR